MHIYYKIWGLYFLLHMGTFASVYTVSTFPVYSSQEEYDEKKECLRRLREIQHDLLYPRASSKQHEAKEHIISYNKSPSNTENIFFNCFAAIAQTIANGVEYLLDDEKSITYKSRNYDQHTLSANVADALRSHGCEVETWRTFSGTVQQRALHQEFIAIVQRTTTADFSAFKKTYNIELTPTIIELADIGVGYNQAQEVKQAALIMDFCKSLLDYGFAYAKKSTLYVAHNIEQAGKRVAQCAEKILEIISFYAQQGFAEAQDIYQHDKFYAKTIAQEAAACKITSLLLPRLCQSISPLFATTSTALLNVAQKFIRHERVVEFAGTKMPFLLRAIKKGSENFAGGIDQVADKVGNMKEFFVKFPFGQAIKDSVEKTNMIVQGQSVYQVVKDISSKLQKGDRFYLDNLHKDHFEVFGKNGLSKTVLDLHGKELYEKVQKAFGRKLK